MASWQENDIVQLFHWVLIFFFVFVSNMVAEKEPFYLYKNTLI